MIKKIREKYTTLPTEVRASFWFLICAFLQRGVSFITTPVFTRIMTTSEYGSFSVFYSWFGIVSIVTTLNLFFGVYVRGLILYEDSKQQFTSSMQGLMLVLIGIWTLIYVVFHNTINFWFELTTKQMFSMLLIIWTNGVFSFWAAEQRVNLEYKRLVVVSILTSVMLPIVQIVLMHYLVDKVNARIYGMTVINILLYPVLFAKHMWRGRRFFSKEIWKYALVFNIPLVPHYLSQTILNSADRIMIERMIGAGEAGIYSLAYSVSQIMAVFNSALMQTIEPWLYKKIKNGEVSSIKKVAYPTFLIIAAVNITLIALAPELVSIFAPKEYYEAIWIIPPVAMSVFFSFMYTFFAVFEFYYKKTQYITIATLIGAILNIILNFLFINIFGYYAAGYTTLICFILYALFHFFFMMKLIKENFKGEKVYEVKVVLELAIGFMICGFMLLFTYSITMIRYLIIVIISIFAISNCGKIIKLVRNIMCDK